MGKQQIGLRQRELCMRFGWNYKDIATIAKQKGISTHNYLQSKTGWILYQELYYPPGTLIKDKGVH